MLAATSDGRGFVVGAGRDDRRDAQGQGADRTSTTPAQGGLLVPADGDHVAIIGENRKLLIFPLEQVPEMARGKGVRLQRYKDGGVSDAKVFALDGRPDLARFRGPHVHGAEGRAEGLDRQSRRRGPAAAEGIPEEQQVRVNRRERHDR